MPEPTPRALHQGEALGRQLMNIVLGLLYEGLETNDQAMIEAAYAKVDMSQHPNPMFRKVLHQYLQIGLYTFTSANPVLNSRLVPDQWVGIKPGDHVFIVEQIRAMRQDLGAQMEEMMNGLEERSTESPESREGPRS